MRFFYHIRPVQVTLLWSVAKDIGMFDHCIDKIIINPW